VLESYDWMSNKDMWEKCIVEDCDWLDRWKENVGGEVIIF
jgi:hypothetical protein